MHLIELNGANQIGMPAGEYLAEDVNAGELLSCGWCSKVKPADKPSFAGGSTTGRKVLFVRPGGFGDLLFLTPTFKEMVRRYPGTQIYVASFDRYRPVLLNNPCVSGFFGYPVSVEVWNQMDDKIWLENIIEQNPKAEKVHAVDLIAERAHLTLKDRRMQYVVTDKERQKAQSEFPRDDNKFKARIGLQVSGKNPGNMLRMYQGMKYVSDKFWQDNYEVFLFGAPGDIRTNEPEGMVNLTQRNKSFRDNSAVLSTCDVFVGPDSAYIHVAGALDVPCLALFGPFPWKLRTVYAPKTRALQGMCPVSPCFHHVRPGKGNFPRFGPCFKSRKCEAMESIEVDRVVREAKKILENERDRQRKGSAAKETAAATA